jgi:SAM-dependent methyltransferase
VSQFIDLLKEFIPNDHYCQATTRQLIDRVYLEKHDIADVMDLGCGAGDSIDLFRAKDPGVRWVGLDIESSQGVASRTRTDACFYTYDGVHIPFETERFDLICCTQVFEHVRHPEPLLLEISRVLKTGGFFIGSVSQLEPYHAYSLWNYTPYGFNIILGQAGLKLKELRPGIDSLTLIMRYALKRIRLPRRWWEKESPANRIINVVGKLAFRPPWWINAVKLYLSGHIFFMAQKE